MRVTGQLLKGTFLKDLGDNAKRLQDLQHKISTGRRIFIPSDDPVGVDRSLTLRHVLNQDTQFERNTDDGINVLEVADQAMEDSSTLLLRLRDIAVRHSTQFFPQTAYDAAAQEVNQLLEETWSISNFKFQGKFIFSGFATSTLPFQDTRNGAGEITQVDYMGNDGVYKEDVGIGVTIGMNIPGSSQVAGTQNVYGPQTNSAISAVTTTPEVFQRLIDMRDALRTMSATPAASLTVMQDTIDNIDNVRNNILNLRTELGVRINRLNIAKNRIEATNVTNTQLKSVVEDLDMAKGISDLRLQEDVYRASLGVGARVLPPSLLDFLR